MIPDVPGFTCELWLWIYGPLIGTHSRSVPLCVLALFSSTSNHWNCCCLAPSMHFCCQCQPRWGDVQHANAVRAVFYWNSYTNFKMIKYYIMYGLCNVLVLINFILSLHSCGTSALWSFSRFILIIFFNFILFFLNNRFDITFYSILMDNL